MSELPTGTITFLFTDIEGSTRLWEEHPDAMRLALARHDALLRAAIETEGGCVFKTVGDAFCAAFSTARQALSASARIQQSLRTMESSATARASALSLRVRVGLHTGAADMRDGDYFGPPLNRLARLLAIGHGGQVLLSEATHALARHELPPRFSVRDLGVHHLRDLGSPEHTFQLCHPDLADEFPQLRSLDALPNNLPHQLTSFVGRVAEMEEARALLCSYRLLTLTGAGGTGKTRLGLQLAAEVLDHYPDGVWLVELAPLMDPNLVPQTIAETLEIRDEASAGVVPGLVAALREKRLLLLLDNCEHLLEAVAGLVASLTKACPGVRILATSREALRVDGEQTYRVPCLALPGLNDFSLLALGRCEAIHLFLERGRLANPHFQMTAATAPAIVRICHRLDGIPLALELAAARVGALPVEQLAERLDESFRILTGGSRTALPQHRTLRALIDWSYELLSDAERVLLRRLAVFAGGWTVKAAEKICAGGPVEEWEVLDLLLRLIEKSLVSSGDAGARFHLLETVREYSWQRVMDASEGEDLRNRHQHWFLQLAEDAEPHLTGSDQPVWLEQLEHEQDNLRAALEWSGQQVGSLDAELRLAGALWRFWGLRGYVTEGRTRLSHAIERASERSELADRARALNGVGMLARLQCDYAAAESPLRESLAIWRQLGRPQEIAQGLNNLGLLAQEQNDHQAARKLHQDSLEIRRGLKDPWGIGVSLNNLGCVAEAEGDLESAWALYCEALDANRIGGSREIEGMILTNLAENAVKLGRYAEAHSLAAAGTRILYELGDRIGLIHCLQTLAYLAIVEELPARAALLYGACERIRETEGVSIAPYEREACLAQLTEARAKLGESGFSTAWNQGAAFSMDETLAFALADDSADPRASGP